MEQLIEYIEKFVKLNSEAIFELKSLATVENYRKNQHILELGQCCTNIWFIKSGMVRKYHIHDGKNVTVWIHTENEIFTSLQSYSQQSPANEYLQACKDTEVIGISRQNSEKLARLPQFVTFSNVLMEKEFANIDMQTREFNQKDALKRIAPV